MFSSCILSTGIPSPRSFRDVIVSMPCLRSFCLLAGCFVNLFSHGRFRFWITRGALIILPAELRRENVASWMVTGPKALMLVIEVRRSLVR